MVRGKNSSGVDRWDIAVSDDEGNDGPISSFFITEFNEVWKAKDLFFELKDMGG